MGSLSALITASIIYDWGEIVRVKSLNGTHKRLTDFTNVVRKQRVNGDFTLSFSTISTERNVSSYPLVAEENSIFDEDGNEYKIKYINQLGDKRKEVSCVHIFFEDFINAYQYDKIKDTINFTQALNHLFAPIPGWTYINQASTVAITSDGFGDKNCLALLQEILDRFGVEFDIDNTNKKVTFKNTIGVEVNAQFRWKHNIKTFSQEIDTKNLSTYIKGFGKNGLTVTYRSPAANTYGERHATPVRDDRFTDSTALTDECKKLINDVPDIRTKIELVELYKNGLKLHNYKKGDTVFIFYEPTGTSGKIRVIEIEDYPYDKSKSPVLELTNFQTNKKSASAILAEFSQVQKTVKMITDADGNLNLQVKRLYRNTNHYSDNTGDWYISPDDPNAYVHIGAGGLDVHKGLVRVEREDGYATIVGGNGTWDFSIFKAFPFQGTDVITDPYFYKTQSTGYADVGFFSFKHTNRYLKLVLVVGVDNGTGAGIRVDNFSDNQEVLWELTHSHSIDENGVGLTATIDFGTPTGGERSFYLRMKTQDATKYAYMRVNKAWLEG